MKQSAKRLLSLVLIAAIVIPLISTPLATTAYAAGSTASGAFGISTPSAMTEDEKKAAANNPFGAMAKNGGFPLLVKSELYITYGWSGNDSTNGVNYVKSHDTTNNSGLPNININGGANRIGYNKNDVGLYDKTYMAASVDGFNPGSGKDEYVALLGLNARDGKLELSLTNKQGKSVSDYVMFERSSLSWLTSSKLHQMNGFLSVACGDFDGDGMDSIIMYEVGAGNSQVPSLRECTVTKSGSSYDIEKGSLVIGKTSDKPYGLFSLLGDASDLTKTEAKNAAKVQLEAADTDKDGYDELVVTVSMNDTHYGEKLKHLGTQVFIYDKLSSGWKLTARFSMKSTGVSANKDFADDRYRMVWGTSTVGNVIASDDSGYSTDFPEIVTVGLQDNESKAMHNINVDGNDMLVYSVIHCTGMTEKDNGTKNYQGKYEAIGYGNLYPNKFTINGFYESEDVSPLLQTKCFSYKSAAEAEAVFISGAVFAWNDNGGDGKLEHLYTTPYYDAGTKKADGYDLDNMQVESIAAGNFDGNEDGREQIVSAYLLKKDDKNNNGFSGLVTIGYYGNTDSDGKNKNDWKYSTAPGGNYIKNKDKAYVALTDFDCDSDSVIVKYEGVDKQWSNPKVMAILAASPYFHDIGLDNNSCTDYGIDRSTETSTETSHTLTTNFVVGYEYSTPLGNGGGVEATIENNLTWSSNNSRTVTYSTNYSNNTDTHQVVVYRSPTLVYKFKNINTNEKVYLSKALSPATTMIPVEEYNEQAASYELNEIDESVLSLGTPGDPNSYPSQISQITSATKDTVMLGDTSWSSYSAEGTITKGVSVAEMSGKSFNYEFDFSFTAYGLIFGAKVGGGAGYGYETTKSVVNGTEISRSGTVEGVGAGDYDFQWNFVTWSTTLNNLTIPVCGYLVQNATAPPSPAENLNITDVTDSSLTLQWESGVRQAEKYDIYRILEASTDPYLYIGSVSGDAEEFTYQLNGLDSGTTYTFMVRGVSGDKESVDSGSATACTLLPGDSRITINPLKNTYSVAPTDSVTLKTAIATSSSIASLTMIWQTRDSSKGTWRNINDATSDSLTLSNVTQRMDGSQYRLRVKAVTTSANVNYYYSNTATLSVNTTDTTATLNITNAIDGNGTLSPYDPYTGNATHTFSEPLYEMQQVDVPVTFMVGEAKGQVYQATIKDPVYIGEIELDGTTKYFVLTKNTDGTYSTSGDALTVKEKYLTSMGAIFEVPTGESDPLTLTIGEGADELVFDAIAMWNSHVEETEKFKKAWHNEEMNLYAEFNGTEYVVYAHNNLEEQGYVELGKLIYADAEQAVAVGKSETYMIYNRSHNENISMTYVRVTLEECVTVGETTRSLSRLEPITKPEEIQVITGYETTTTNGTALNLSATLRKANNGRVLTGIGADFIITDQSTGLSEIIHKTSGSDGKISTDWTASSAGLYAIQVSIPGTDTLSSCLTVPQYYYASSQSNETQYRLRLQMNGSDVANSVSYGDTISLIPQSKTGTEDWTTLEIDPDLGLSLTTALQGDTVSTLSGTSYVPDKAGKYTFSLVKTEGTTQTALATATLTVNFFKLTVTPVWEGTIPSSLDAITLKFTDASGNKITSLPNNDMEKLEGALIKTSTYDFTNTNPDSGIYYVNLSWSTDTKEETQNNITALKNAYSITLSNASFYKVSDAAPVRYEVVGGNGSIDATGKQYIHFTSGEQQSQGTPLRFQATPATGYLVKNWKVNGNVVSEDSTDYVITPISGGNAQMLTISSFDTQRDVANGELLVQVEFTNQTSTVNYSAVGNGSLTAKTSHGTDVPSGASLVYGASVVFTAVPEDGQMVKEWKVTINNGTAKTYTWPESGDIYRENTLTLSDLAENNYTVSVEFTKKQTFTVAEPVLVDSNGNSVNVGTITMTDANGWPVSENDEMEQGKAINYTLEFTDSNYNTVNAWEYSTDGTHWINDSDGGHLNYFCCKGNTGTLYVRAVVSVTQNYTVNWKVMEDSTVITDTSIASLTATSGNTTLTSGGSYPVNTPVDFNLKLANDYYVVGWNNATPAEDGKSAALTLTANTVVTVTIAKKPIVTWSHTTNGTLSVEGTVNGNKAEISSGHYADFGKSVTFTAIPDDGYRVKGWYSDEAGTKPISGTTSGQNSYTIENLSADTSVHVVFELILYTITFDTDGGTTIDPITQAPGTTVTAPADPVKTGYTFVGWDKDIPALMPKEDITLTAIWKINQYTITFDTNGGTTIDPIIQDYGSSVTAPDDPTKTGYTFVDWDKAIPKTMPAKDVTITAQWKINQYTITFKTNGGTTIDPITQDYGTTVTAPDDPVRKGYGFGGWYEDETLSDTPFVFTEDTTITDRDITLYAKWNPLDNIKYTVKHNFEKLDGTFETEIEELSGVTDTETKAQAKNVTGFTAGNVTQQTINGDESTVIEITYTRNTYTLTFKPENGAKDIITNVKYGTDISAPETLTKTGYTFVGWDKEIPQTMPAEDVTITAMWEINQYTITFKDGDTTIASITQDYGTAVTAPENPTRIGCTFIGWDKEVPETMPAKDVTITAQWVFNMYTIKLESIENGSVSANHYDAAMGDTITLTVVPDEDYALDTLTVTDENGDGISLTTLDDGKYSFTMPASEVSIKASFAHANHSYTLDVTAPTCTEQGYTTHTCSVCGDSYTDSYVDANGHSFGEWTVTKAATCTEKGSESRSCTICEETETREIAALGHNYQNRTCINCGKKQSLKDWLDKIFGDWWGDEEETCDHAYASVVTEPTCEEQGYTTHTCEKCGDSYKDSYTDALGHEWNEGDITAEATCTEDGETTFTCETCGKTKIEEIDAPGHNFENGICTECGEEETSKPENPNKPSWDNIWDWISGWWK